MACASSRGRERSDLKIERRCPGDSWWRNCGDQVSVRRGYRMFVRFWALLDGGYVFAGSFWNSLGLRELLWNSRDTSVLLVPVLSRDSRAAAQFRRGRRQSRHGNRQHWHLSNWWRAKVRCCFGLSRARKAVEFSLLCPGAAAAGCESGCRCPPRLGFARAKTAPSSLYFRVVTVLRRCQASPAMRRG